MNRMRGSIFSLLFSFCLGFRFRSGTHILTLFLHYIKPIKLQKICGFPGLQLCKICLAAVCAVCAPYRAFFRKGQLLGGYPSRPTRGNVGAVCGLPPQPPWLAAGIRLPSRSAESEGVVAGKVLRQGFSCCCEFIANEAHSHQPSPHRELFVFLLLFLRACAAQVFCHLAHCEAKLNVALELACVKSVLLAACGLVELEKAEFNCGNL